VVNSDDIGECLTSDVEKNSDSIEELPSEADNLQCSEESPPETDKFGETVCTSFIIQLPEVFI
jgi:hypothetical protein